MAQTGYTPIQLYRTTTAGAAPSAGNLNPGELGFNIADADMALYAKNNTGTVKRLINNPAGLKYPTADGTAGQGVVTDGAGNLSFGSSGGTVTSASVVSANGFAGTVATATTTPAITLTTSITGVLKGNGTAISAAVAGTDYVTPTGTETLTNKTINIASNTLTGVQSTLVSGTSIKTINSTSLLGSGDIAVGASVVLSSRTANTILGTADNSTLVNITSGTFTQTFTAAATLGSGWFVYLRNSGTGDITLDPNASELIDGLTTYIMYPGECRLIQCSGTAFTSVVLVTFSRTFTSSGTFTKPPGYAYLGGLLWGGGGGGGKNSTFGNAYGGGGGACVPFTLLASLFGATETITVAAGGTGATVDLNNGNVGGDSSIGTVVRGFGGCQAGGGILTAANGASPGQPYNTASTRANDGFGGSPASSDLLINCSVYGGAGGAGNNTFLAAGGRSVYGGGGGGVSGGAGGVSFYGGNGGLSGTTASGTVGAAPGGGGGATDTGAAGGAGGRGEVRLWGIV